MERVVDLDAVVVELDQRRQGWSQRGLVVGEFTWRDSLAPWPQPLVADRALVTDPESLGLTFGVGQGPDARLVLWTGGWADLEAIIHDQIVLEVPQFSNVRSCVAVADALVQRLLRAWVLR